MYCNEQIALKILNPINLRERSIQSVECNNCISDLNSLVLSHKGYFFTQIIPLMKV